MEIKKIRKSRNTCTSDSLAEKTFDSDALDRKIGLVIYELDEIYVDIADYQEALMLKGRIKEQRKFKFVIEADFPEYAEIKCSYIIIGKYLYLKWHGEKNSLKTVFEKQAGHFF